MRFYTLRRAWTSLLVVGVPVSVLALIWATFLGGRTSVAALAFVYLVIVACGRALAIKQELAERPYREVRVAHQVARIRSTLPGADESVQLVKGPSVEDFRPEPDSALEPKPVESLTLRAV